MKNDTASSATFTNSVHSLSLTVSAFRMSYSLASVIASELTHNHTSAVDDISYAIEDAILSIPSAHPSDTTSSLPPHDAALQILALLTA